MKSFLLNSILLTAIIFVGFHPVIAEENQTPTSSKATKHSSKILVLVNSEPITNVDLEKRRELIKKLESGSANVSKEIILKSLIDDKIFLSTAKKLDLEVSDKELEYHINRLNKQNNVPEDFLKNFFKQYPHLKKPFEEKIRASVAWHKILINKVQNKITRPDENILSSSLYIAPEYITFDYIIIESRDGKKLKKLDKVTCDNIADTKDYLYHKHFSDLAKLDRNLTDILLKAAPNQLISLQENQALILCNREIALSEKEQNDFWAPLLNHKLSLAGANFLLKLRQKSNIEYLTRSMNNLPITDYSAAWLDYLLHENNLSKNTIEAYQRDLTAFFAFITQFYGQEITLELLAKLALSDFRSWLSSRYQADFNSNSTKRALSAVKNFFHFLEQQHNIINSAIGQVKSPKTKQNLPKVISGEQVKDLIDSVRNNSKAAWLAERDLAIILLLFGAGLRISEALNITYQQFSEASNFLTIRGKGSKERVIPLLPIIKEQINQYVTLCPYHFITDSALFFGAQGSPLNRRSFNENLSKLQLSLGWLESFSPHSLRHGFATALLNSSNNIRYIQELLGHASLASTQVYTKTSIAQLSNIYQRFHPLGDTKEDKEK